jgi:hypothetical protein
VAAADWVALKAGLFGHSPVLLAALAGLAMAALLVRGVVRSIDLARSRRPVAGAEALVIFGVLTALGAGTANWLLGLQGFVVLYEGERVPLAGGSHLQELVGGPLARIGEMDVVLGLEEVELLPVGSAAATGERSFVPRSRLVVERPSGNGTAEAGTVAERLEVEPGRLAAAGSLRFHQGAFGFAPRIVIRKEGETVFDRVVPFTTERAGGPSGSNGGPAGVRGVAFEGAFTLARESLRVDGRVDLASLDAGLRGHATLDLAVRRLAVGEESAGPGGPLGPGGDGEVLGRGRLLPGHFAEIGDGYRVGFAGLEKWSEILLSRRGYGELLLGGASAAALGLAVLGLTWVVARRSDR